MSACLAGGVFAGRKKADVAGGGRERHVGAGAFRWCKNHSGNQGEEQ